MDDYQVKVLDLLRLVLYCLVRLLRLELQVGRLLVRSDYLRNERGST
jgi:hypothetical protein